MSAQPIRICHLTSVHRRDDVRIFHKECKSLSRVYDVHLIVADGLGDDNIDGVAIHDAGPKQKKRLSRFFNTTRSVYQLACIVHADVYHFHDPELITAGLRLKQSGKKVIYDAHEDVPRDIISKDYLGILRKPLSLIVEFFENQCVRYFNGLITATPHIRKRFSSRNQNTIDINNYPLLDELTDNSYFGKPADCVSYIGAISRVRGVKELVQSLKYTNLNLEIAGLFETEHFEQELKSLPEWSRVTYHGYVDRFEIKKILDRSMAGMVTLHPTPGYLNSQPIKLYEYMAAGIPVIASHFSFWKNLVEGNKCGICVDPLNPKEIGEAINYLSSNPDQAKQMGTQGQRMVQTEFNWAAEEKKLLQFYQLIINS